MMISQKEEERRIHLVESIQAYIKFALISLVMFIRNKMKRKKRKERTRNSES
jgi:large-conductance mechanosensitive channel